MKYTTKSKIGIVVGIGLIVFVASFLTLPFADSNFAVEEITEEKIQEVEDAEEKLLGVITQEKAELESKMGGKLAFP